MDRRSGVRIRVRGQVQGVGFRPFVWQLASRLGVTGEVLNDPEGVLIHAAGSDLDAFAAALRAEAPPLARIEAIEVEAIALAASAGFVIAASQGRGAETRVTPDAATCPACAAEIRAPGRRQGYAFTNCTHCGPRFTILQGLPYDRAQTTMAAFPMCPACRAEYDNPADRRFHAQPVACPACGPRVWLEVDGAAAGGIAEAAALLRDGRILAVKGLGGFHLACDATDTAAIARLRARKRRPAKPLALMAPLGVIRRHAVVTDADAALLADPAAPIVLLPRAGASLPGGLAPGLAHLGWMLPANPLHHLLADAADRPLVMTSGNLSGEPMVIGNDEARAKLSAFCDGFLMHDRDIARRLDDSVERAEPPMAIRRGRGRVPGTLPLPPGFKAAPQVLALGGQMKGAICLVKNGQALLGHHLGDLDDALCAGEFDRAVADYTLLFDHRPERVAVDAHPGYRATMAGEGMGLPVTRVWHHHAHLASCLAENLWPLDGGPVAGIVLDGTGLGPDGTIWGGELLVGDYRGFRRAAWLRPAPLPGGDRAAREPWRNALMRLDQAGLSGRADRLFPDQPRDLLRDAARKGINAPLSSSAGRLFDAVAACLDVCATAQTYEGEAAMRLEAMAGDGVAVDLPDGPEIDPAPFFRALPGLPDPAGSFHRTLARAFARRARAEVAAGARAVALSGGCLMNAQLLGRLLEALQGLPVLTQTRVPANDGGLALGQAVIAAAEGL